MTPMNRNRFIGIQFQRGFIFGAIMVAALVAFELFNFGTTEFALNDLLGGADVLGVQWASVLAIAFCAIDFAGLARLFTPEQGREEPKEIWFLMGAWFLGACANAAMTWWAISLALLPRNIGNEILSREQILAYVPVFVAALVWLTRILIIGTFGIAGERVFTLGSSDAYRPAKRAQAAPKPASAKRQNPSPRSTRPANNNRRGSTQPYTTRRTRPAPKPGTPSYGYSASERSRSIVPTASPWGSSGGYYGETPKSHRKRDDTLMF